MLDLRSIHSPSEYQRNTKEFLQQMKESRGTVTLTVNGRAEVVVQGAKSCQEMLTRLERAEMVAAIRRGMKDLDDGCSTPAATTAMSRPSAACTAAPSPTRSKSPCESTQIPFEVTPICPCLGRPLRPSAIQALSWNDTGQTLPNRNTPPIAVDIIVAVTREVTARLPIYRGTRCAPS